jgi:hypothetical protein
MNDKYAGQGGSYILDPKTNKRVRVEEPTTGYARTTKSSDAATPATVDQSVTNQPVGESAAVKKYDKKGEK